MWAGGREQKEEEGLLEAFDALNPFRSSSMFLVRGYGTESMLVVGFTRAHRMLRLTLISG